MPDDDADLRFEEPSSLDEGKTWRDEKKQEVGELAAALSAHNAQAPKGPGSRETVAGRKWAERRARLVRKKTRVDAHYRYLKQWVAEHENKLRFASDMVPSDVLKIQGARVASLERVFFAAQEFLVDDSDENFEELENAVREASSFLTGEAVEAGNALEAGQTS